MGVNGGKSGKILLCGGQWTPIDITFTSDFAHTHCTKQLNNFWVGACPFNHGCVVLVFVFEKPCFNSVVVTSFHVM